MASADCRAERGCAKCTRYVTANRSRVITSRWMSNSSPSRINAARKSAVFNIRLSTTRRAFERFDHVIEKFPFRIKEIRTDNGHEFQAKFHWHVEDKGIRHAYIKKGTPQLNGKVERSHRSVNWTLDLGPLVKV